MKTLKSVLLPQEVEPDPQWQLRVGIHDDCLSYIVWNERTREAILVDPKLELAEEYRSVARDLKGTLWLGVIDTHTHADHISSAAAFAKELRAPLIMHALSPSKRVDLRVAKATTMPAHADGIRFIPTPGHTPDGMCVLWGPFLFTGDTVLHGDVGRDDLPGGSPEDHYDSLWELKNHGVPDSALILPGHDCKGGRVSSWGTQLKMNPSLTQGREAFVAESAAFDAPAPALLKKSLAENFR